jgi:hypothetical protein
MALGLPLAVMQTDDSISPQISFDTSSIEVSLPRVDISWQGPNLIKGIKFDLQNNSSQSIVAIGLSWIFFSDDECSKGTQASFTLDTWNHAGGELLPGKTWKEELPFSLQTKSPIMRVEGRISYLEYADGSKLGTDRDEFYHAFSKYRLKIIETYRKLSELYKNQGSKTLEDTIRAGNSTVLNTSAEPLTSEDKLGYDGAFMILKGILTEQGLQGLISEISRPLRLP